MSRVWDDAYMVIVDQDDEEVSPRVDGTITIDGPALLWVPRRRDPLRPVFASRPAFITLVSRADGEIYRVPATRAVAPPLSVTFSLN